MAAAAEGNRAERDSGVGSSRGGITAAASAGRRACNCRALSRPRSCCSDRQ
jgi:hypothetical protein